MSNHTSAACHRLCARLLLFRLPGNYGRYHHPGQLRPGLVQIRQLLGTAVDHHIGDIHGVIAGIRFGALHERRTQKKPPDKRVKTVAKIKQFALFTEPNGCFPPAYLLVAPATWRHVDLDGIRTDPTAKYFRFCEFGRFEKFWPCGRR